MDQILVDLVQPALELDSYPQHALNNYSLQSEADIKLMFDKITYNKGNNYPNIMMLSILEHLFSLLVSLGSVSYTHLDVYKRQMLSRP